jgi:hypothetical protein
VAILVREHEGASQLPFGSAYLSCQGLTPGQPVVPVVVHVGHGGPERHDTRGGPEGFALPLPSDHFGHWMSLYTDDLVLFLLPKQEDFICIRAILDLFAGASGLLTNGLVHFPCQPKIFHLSPITSNLSTHA